MSNMKEVKGISIEDMLDSFNTDGALRKTITVINDKGESRTYQSPDIDSYGVTYANHLYDLKTFEAIWIKIKKDEKKDFLSFIGIRINNNTGISETTIIFDTENCRHLAIDLATIEACVEGDGYYTVRIIGLVFKSYRLCGTRHTDFENIY